MLTGMMTQLATALPRPATALDGLSPPPVARLLGWHILDARPETGWIRIGFQGRDEFLNPAGFIQGGILAAMLDDTMGPAVFAMTEGALYTATIDMNVSYLAPARVGLIIGEGQVVQLGKTVAFLEARLIDEAGAIIARATSTARLVPAAKALA
jgi:uncharacterized protein (TIGR00369 family)